VLLAGQTEESLNFTQQAKELNVCPKLIAMTVGPSEADFRKSLGKDAECIYGVASWSTQMNFKGTLFDDTQQFVKLFKAQYNYDPDYHNASGIADVAIFKDAIERAGSLDPQKVRDAIAATDLNTIYGRVQFSGDGQKFRPTQRSLPKAAGNGQGAGHGAAGHFVRRGYGRPQFPGNRPGRGIDPQGAKRRQNHTGYRTRDAGDQKRL
jgi:branched-chain amino acid transport system substrate-binding protein